MVGDFVFVFVFVFFIALLRTLYQSNHFISFRDDLILAISSFTEELINKVFLNFCSGSYNNVYDST